MDKKQVDKIRKVAQKIIGSPVTTLNDNYDTKIMCKVKSVINDTSHPLFSCYQWLPSGKTLRSVTCKTKCHAESFVPKSVMILNKISNICKYMIALLCIYKYIDIAVLLHMCQHVTKYLNGLIKYILSYLILLFRNQWHFGIP